MDNIIVAVLAIIGTIVLAIIVGALMAFPVMWLWNGCLVGTVAGVSKIGWATAWGLNILCGLLFTKHSFSNTSK